MKWLLALVSLTLLASCNTKPWMVGSYNDKGCRCCKNGKHKYNVPTDINAEPEAAPYSGKSGKDSRSVMP
jgi:hypothetical protein